MNGIKIENDYLKKLRILMTKTSEDKKKKKVQKKLDIDEFIDLMVDLDLSELDEVNQSDFQMETYVGLILLAPKSGLEYYYCDYEDDKEYMLNFKIIN